MASNIAPILIRAFDQTKQAFASVNSSLNGVKQSALSLQGVMGGVFAGVTIQQAAKLADAYNSVNARLRLVSGSTQEYTNAQRELFKISQDTRAGYSETADLFATLSRSTKDLGVSQSEMLSLTENINKALVVSGASGASAQAALTQLSQAFASGVLRGEEFNSISEQAPVILGVLAKGLGKTRGELRGMAADGQITTELFLKAFAAGAGDVASQFDKMPVTIAGSMTRIQNSLMVLVGSMDNATGASSSFATNVDALAKFMDSLAISIDKNKDGIALILKMAGAAAGVLAVAGAVGVLKGAIIALGVAARANPVITALMLAGSAAAYIYDSLKSNELPENARGKGFDDPRIAKQAVKPIELPKVISKAEQKEIDNQIKLNESLVSQMTDIERQKRFGMASTYRIAEAYKEQAKATTDAYVAARNLRNSVGLAEQQALLDVIDNSITPLREYANSVDNVQASLQNVALSGLKSMEDALVGLVNGTMSAKDAFRSMASSIINDLIRIMIQKSITGPIAGAMDGFFSGGGKAIGGSVQSGKPYMVGERGAEMFVPNQSGSIIPSNRLGGGGGTVVNQVINITTGVQQTVRAEIMTLMPQIANAAKSAVADANLRGGSYRTAMR